MRGTLRGGHLIVGEVEGRWCVGVDHFVLCSERAFAHDLGPLISIRDKDYPGLRDFVCLLTFWTFILKIL